MDERLPAPFGKWIARGTRVSFRFEGQARTGYAGDTVSAALWAEGVRVLGRSFKHHRPRGVFSMGGTDANVLVESATETHMRGDVTPISEGVDLRAVNTWGGVASDRLRLLERLSAVTPVGFYYKAFHTPRFLFPWYERLLRRLGGLGRVDPNAPMRHPPKRYAFCDVLVVGSGPAGLSAALSAAASGARVLLAEQDPHPGGSLLFEPPERLEALLAQVRAADRITLRTSTSVVSLDSDNWAALMDEAGLTKLRARSVVMATGCYEHPAVFRNNDLPGVMLGSGARRLMHLYGVRPFTRGVVLAANPEAYRTALDLRAAGVEVAEVADLRPDGEPSRLGAETEACGIAVSKGWGVYEALPASGNGSVCGVRLCPVRPDGNPAGGPLREVACDGVVLSVGWTPADGLLRQAGAAMPYDATLEQCVPGALPEGVFAAGRLNGVYELEAQCEDGRSAGAEAVVRAGFGGGGVPARPQRERRARSHPYPIWPHPKGRNYVDFDEDLQLEDLEDALQEGFDHTELLKRYASAGMGPSQGKHWSILALRVLARREGTALAGRQLPTARPYAVPTPLSHFAGAAFLPRRRTSLHERHAERRAEFMVAGAWLRPACYPAAGESRPACIENEVLAVRKAAGVFDVGTLGKVEIDGAGAAEFLERMYTGVFANLGAGRARYGLLCDESGIVIDDGIIARLDDGRFYVTTTTSGADAVFREMQRNALVWRSAVTLTNCTPHYGALSVAGPNAPALLSDAAGQDLREAALPPMGVREGHIAGVPVRVLRLGFVSRLGYEVHFPADGAVTVWDALQVAGKPHGLRPFGVEAQRVLRLEMGHLLIGRDTDALTNPYEANLGWALKMDKPFFVGQRSLRILAGKPPTRQLAGFVLDPDHRGPLPEECHLVIDDGAIAGRVTSIARSPSTGAVIGLAYVRPGQAVPGTVFRIRGERGVLVQATVTPPPFHREEDGR